MEIRIGITRIEVIFDDDDDDDIDNDDGDKTDNDNRGRKCVAQNYPISIIIIEAGPEENHISSAL